MRLFDFHPHSYLLEPRQGDAPCACGLRGLRQRKKGRLLRFGLTVSVVVPQVCRHSYAKIEFVPVVKNSIDTTVRQPSPLPVKQGQTGLVGLVCRDVHLQRKPSRHLFQLQSSSETVTCEHLP